MTQLERLKTEAVALSPEERAELAHFLLLSLDQEEDPDAEATWDEELRRRAAEIQSGTVTGKSAAEIFRRPG
jgi:putative addiction module component (TIGR02574 family)